MTSGKGGTGLSSPLCFRGGGGVEIERKGGTTLLPWENAWARAGDKRTWTLYSGPSCPSRECLQEGAIHEMAAGTHQNTPCPRSGLSEESSCWPKLNKLNQAATPSDIPRGLPWQVPGGWGAAAQVRLPAVPQQLLVLPLLGPDAARVAQD